MMWVAIDRGLRLADKRNLPCPNRINWMEKRDALYEEIQDKGWNAEKKHYKQCYEEPESLDSAVCTFSIFLSSSLYLPQRDFMLIS